MNNRLTRLAIVLDRSGSMERTRAATISGFNEFIGQLRTGVGEVKVKLVQFDHEYEEVFDCDLSLVPQLSLDTFVPRGNTALLDAQGRTIDDLGKELEACPDSGRPGKVIVMTVTDGEENWSKKYTQSQVASMVEHQQGKYGWEFMYLGANQDAIGAAAKMNIPQRSSMTYRASSAGTHAIYEASAMHVNSTRAAQARGMSVPMAFDDMDRVDVMADDDQPAATPQP